MENSNIITFKLNVTELDELSDIIKGLRGELYPCKPDVFEKKYEAI